MFGCVCVTLAAVAKGVVIVIPSDGFDPKSVLKAIADERCTAIYGSPGSFIAMMEDPDYTKFDFGLLRTGIMEGRNAPWT